MSDRATFILKCFSTFSFSHSPSSYNSYALPPPLPFTNSIHGSSSSYNSHFGCVGARTANTKEPCVRREAEGVLPTSLGCVQPGLIERSAWSWSLLPPLEPRNRDSVWPHLVRSVDRTWHHSWTSLGLLQSRLSPHALSSLPALTPLLLSLSRWPCLSSHAPPDLQVQLSMVLVSPIPPSTRVAATAASGSSSPMSGSAQLLGGLLLLIACLGVCCLLQYRRSSRKRDENETEPLISRGHPPAPSGAVRQDVATIGSPARDFVRLSSLPAAIFQPNENRCRACGQAGECVALRPCGHMVLCRPCSDFVCECPHCGQYVSGVAFHQTSSGQSDDRYR